MSELTGLYIHTFGFYDGGYIVITNYPLSAQDKAGTPNDSFCAQTPDAALLSCQQQAIEALGPNVGLFKTTSVFLRRDSRHAIVHGAEVDLCQKGESLAAYQSEDGYLMVPIAFCAEALGGTSSLQPDGSSVVSYRGHTVVFPAENGILPWTAQWEKDIRILAAASKTAELTAPLRPDETALGLYGYADSQTKGDFDHTVQSGPARGSVEAGLE